MTKCRTTDENIEQLVKARWLEIGLSQSDLAEVLGAAFQQTSTDDDGSNRAGASRLMQVAEALDIPVDLFHNHAVRTGHEEPDLSSAQDTGSLQSLLELRLLRAYRELTDHRTKRMLVQLAERIIKRQANRRGDAG
jgi:transcriptional regulator with XRE-family HTH domain